MSDILERVVTNKLKNMDPEIQEEVTKTVADESEGAAAAPEAVEDAAEPEEKVDEA